MYYCPYCGQLLHLCTCPNSERRATLYKKKKELELESILPLKIYGTLISVDLKDGEISITFSKKNQSIVNDIYRSLTKLVGKDLYFYVNLGVFKDESGTE